jgi:hypothetical protein
MSPTAHAIETLSGSMFDFDEPRAQDVDINDIATALGNLCRFGGHTRRYYSVAEHAVLVYRLVRDAGYEPEVCFAALHHDSHEAYLGDIPTPLKRLMGDARHDLEAAVDRAIAQRLVVDLTPNTAVKSADSLALSYEAAVLKPSGRAQRHEAWVQVDPADVPTWAVVGYPPTVATHRFLTFHREAERACG